MGQERLDNLMILHIHHDFIDSLNMFSIGIEFILGRETLKNEQFHYSHFCHFLSVPTQSFRIMINRSLINKHYENLNIKQKIVGK